MRPPLHYLRAGLMDTSRPPPPPPPPSGARPGASPVPRIRRGSSLRHFSRPAVHDRGVLPCTRSLQEADGRATQPFFAGSLVLTAVEHADVDLDLDRTSALLPSGGLLSKDFSTLGAPSLTLLAPFSPPRSARYSADRRGSLHSRATSTFARSPRTLSRTTST